MCNSAMPLHIFIVKEVLHSAHAGVPIHQQITICIIQLLCSRDVWSMQVAIVAKLPSGEDDSEMLYVASEVCTLITPNEVAFEAPIVLVLSSDEDSVTFSWTQPQHLTDRVLLCVNSTTQLVSAAWQLYSKQKDYFAGLLGFRIGQVVDSCALKKRLCLWLCFSVALSSCAPY